MGGGPRREFLTGKLRDVFNSFILKNGRHCFIKIATPLRRFFRLLCFTNILALLCAFHADNNSYDIIWS